jgi:hypothetical protein
VHDTTSLTRPRRPVGNNAARNPFGSRRQTAIKYPRGPEEGRRSEATIRPMRASCSRSKEERGRQISVSLAAPRSRGTELDSRAVR